MFERDLDDEKALVNPILYQAGQLKKYFNFKVFWKWIGFSILHGGGCFYICTYVSINKDLLFVIAPGR